MEEFESHSRRRLGMMQADYLTVARLTTGGQMTALGRDPLGMITN